MTYLVHFVFVFLIMKIHIQLGYILIDMVRYILYLILIFYLKITSL
jgi:hypothetical protein